jgi:DNA modification methylase
LKPYYQHGGVTIYHGSAEDVLPELPAYDTICTDPPYGLGEKWSGGKKKWPLHHGQMDWDAATIENLPELILPRAKQVIIWGGHLYPLPPLRGWLIWDKIVREFTSGHCEMAWSNLDQPVKAFSYSHGALATEGKYHPTQKPLPLMEWCLSFTSGTVCDPFMGAGTTLLAAKNNGRDAVGIDRSEAYCEIAANRLRQEVFSFV